MGLLITLGWIAFVVGIILVILGYTVAPQALRPGIGATVLGLVLIVVGYLIPSIGAVSYDNDAARVSIESG